MRRILFALTLAGCSGTTGSHLVSFTALAGGPSDATGQLEFDTGKAYHVVLTRAELHLGAVYLNMAAPLSGGAEQPCILPGIYVGQAFAGLDLDLLSPNLIPFNGAGEGTANRALVGEVWLTGEDINASDDRTPVLQVAGTASKPNGTEWPFTATVTIGANRKVPPMSTAMPGTNPICLERIVSPICLLFDPNSCPGGLPGGLNLTDGGTLTLRIDPRGMFNNVDFASLPPTTGTYVIPDAQGGVGDQLFSGLRSRSGVYQFSFNSKP
jgi:hypothetical protein